MKYLKKWQRASNYMGQDYFEYYVFLSRNRDSKNLEESNFEVGLKRLGGESESVLVVRNNHWACGWIEFVAIHESAVEKLNQAEEMLIKLNESYPILDEQDYSDRQWEKANNYWKSLTPEYRWKDYLENKGYPKKSAKMSLSSLLHKYDGELYENLTCDD